MAQSNRVCSPGKGKRRSRKPYLPREILSLICFFQARPRPTDHPAEAYRDRSLGRRRRGRWRRGKAGTLSRRCAFLKGLETVDIARSLQLSALSSPRRPPSPPPHLALCRLFSREDRARGPFSYRSRRTVDDCAVDRRLLLLAHYLRSTPIQRL